MPDFQGSSENWVPYHAAMEPSRRQIAATQTAATVAAVSGIAITTSTAIAANPGFYDQFIACMTSPVAWSAAVIQSKVIDFVTYILTQPAALIGWTESEWAMLHEWLLHIAVNLIHLAATGIH